MRSEWTLHCRCHSSPNPWSRNPTRTPAVSRLAVAFLLCTKAPGAPLELSMRRPAHFFRINTWCATNKSSGRLKNDVARMSLREETSFGQREVKLIVDVPGRGPKTERGRAHITSPMWASLAFHFLLAFWEHTRDIVHTRSCPLI